MAKKKPTDNTKQPITMSHMNFHSIILLSFFIRMSLSDCPRLCECKWKNGKESVICLNATLSVIPLHLEAGTQVLDLTGNNIVTIKHEEFSNAGLVNLQKVYIAKCRLKSIERYAFKNLINLVELDLSYNALNSIPSHSFDSISELRELKLSGNPIQKILNDAFLHIPQLVRLEISSCRIVTIEPRAFFGLEKSLEWLKLDKNKLTEVQSSSFTVLQNLHGLELAGNPWNCSCALRPLREWMLRRNVPYDIPPVCQDPKRLYQKSWDKLDLDEFACIPEIFAYDGKAHGIEGKNVTMTCRIAGIPNPNVKWLLKNKVIANLSGSAFSSGKKLYMVHLNNNSSDLTIFSADLQDAGTYVCSAENKAGKAEASVTLAVSKKSPESTLAHKVLLISISMGIIFAFVAFIIAFCLCSVRKKQVLKWRSRECRREDNYEKIEMNQKVVRNVNGGVNRDDNELVGVNRKNGDYRVVPGTDTDQENDEEEESTLEITTPGTSSGKKWSNGDSAEKRWNSPEHLLDQEDLHIPRRTLQESRDNIKKTYSSTFGTYKQNPAGPVTPLHTLYTNKSPGNIYATTCNAELSRLPETGFRDKTIPDGRDRTITTDRDKALPRDRTITADRDKTLPRARTIAADREKTLPRDRTVDKTIPDVIGNSSRAVNSRTQSEGGSVSDITELFCTLPRKRDLSYSARYRSSDSQSPLLPESRYGSSGSSYGGSQETYVQKLNPSSSNLNRNRVNKMSNSYLSLTRDENNSETNATPLLDVSALENRLTGNANTSYDYHAAQLERFLEEYRSLQKQLTKMKETCDNLCQEKRGPENITQASGSSASCPIVSPNSNKSIEDSVDFRNFESELTKYLLSKSSSPKNCNSSVFPN